MTITTTNCPSCGGPIVFKLGSSIVVVCEYCNSAVARTDRDVRNLGKVADVVDTRSPLEVGKDGRYDGQPFVLTGRAQIAHPAGGVWDEWYATFGDGRTGWLAESQGRFYMTFPVRVADPSVLPTLATMRPGSSVVVPGAPEPFVVAEVGSAKTVAAQGEIPYELEPNAEYYFADLAARSGAFATLDFSEQPPILFVGREVTLRDLGIFGEADEFSADKRRVGSVRLTCPQCGGPMELRAPESERATCPSCNALLDVDQGNLSYLKTLAAQARPLIPLGSVGKFSEGELTVIGFMTRYCVVEGSTYRWDEYLLYNPQVGFRWLVNDSGHWSYVGPLSAGEVFDGETVANFRGEQFKQFQYVTATVESVYGEFFWRVEVGEQTYAKDYVRPPEILSREHNASELNWSYGTYMPSADVAAAFKRSSVPAPTVAVGMAQPNPHVGKSKPWLALLLIAFVVGVAFQLMASRREVFKQTFSLQALESAQGTQVAFSDDFDLDGMKNTKVVMSAPVDNSWVYVEGDLVNEETGLVQNFSMPIEYYHGVDGGDSWSEGAQRADMHLSALPAGRYTIRLEAQWEKWQQPLAIGVTVQQGVPRLIYWGVLMGLLSLGLVVQWLRKYNFERRRWSESMFNPYASNEE